jgi:hypothetical protein
MASADRWSTGATDSCPLKLFYSYSRKDEPLREQLDSHLAGLRRRGLIAPWFDRNIAAGSHWEQEILENLDNADIILLLISSDFLKSDYCYSKEMGRAMERHERGEARVVPVILRPVLWKSTPLAKLNALPRDAKPVTKWSNRDEAWADVARGIEEICRARQDAPSARGADEPDWGIADARRLRFSSGLDYLADPLEGGLVAWNAPGGRDGSVEVCEIVEGREYRVGPATKFFDVNLTNKSSEFRFAKYFDYSCRYYRGMLCSVDEGRALEPLAKYVIEFRINIELGGGVHERQLIYPTLVLPPRNDSGPSLTTFRLQLHYSLVGRISWHPNADWAIHYDVACVLDNGDRLPLFHDRSWRRDDRGGRLHDW